MFIKMFRIMIILATVCVCIFGISSMTSVLQDLEKPMNSTLENGDEQSDLLFPGLYPNHGDMPALNRKIFQGYRVPITEHPYIVSIRRNFAHILVGSLLTRTLVITVAHPIHEFPKDPKIKEKWIEATGNVNWFPTKHSRICSIHFDQNCYTKAKKHRMLSKTAYPTKGVLKLINVQPSQEKDNIDKTPRKRKLEESIDELSTSEENLLCTSKKKKILNKLNRARQTIKDQEKQIKRLREQNRRKVKKLLSLMAILTCLKKKTLVSDEQADSLKTLNVTTSELYSRQMKNVKRSVTTTSKYSPALRSFALTLHYYSHKAYNYVRKVFNLCLPHPNTLRNWYKVIDGNPGFTTEAFETLKLMAKQRKNPLFCCLMLDEMAIRRKIEWDGKKFQGYVDFGGGLDTDEAPEAKEALVFMVTGVNASWKVPVGYFLIDGANGKQKAELVLQCLRHLNESNITVVGLTFDGCPSNLTMAKTLGCNLEPNDDMKTTFNHPVTKKPIAIFLDACHMIKLVRNCLQAYGNIVDGNGDVISWSHLENLHNLQNSENFHLANKLRKNHISFHNQKMKVKLATQLLSNSVAIALDFCREKLKIPAFKKSSATAEFIRVFNDLFDVLNSRNIKMHGFKRPLNLKNKTQVMELLAKAENYISKLQTSKGDSLLKSGRKTGFIGLLVCIKSTRILFERLVEEEKMKFLSMYRFSQDHLELFFCNVRAHGGCNNNPTSKQFQAFYKKLLCHVEIKNSNNGNCTELEKISVLNCSSAIKTINATTTRGTLTEGDDDECKDLNMSSLRDFDEFCSNMPKTTEFTEQIIAYIAGYVVRSLGKIIKCNECNSALSLPESRTCHTYNFITFKDKGGLLYPSKDTIQICKVAELKIKELMNTSKNLSMNPSLTKSQITNKVLQYFINSNIFSSIAIHQYDQQPTENHLINLMKAIAGTYIDLRLRYLTKHMKSVSTKRQIYNKLILFQGQ